MARCALLPAGPGFEQPPLALRELDPLLYDYLTALHQVIFGTLGNPQGSLGVDNFSGDLGAAPEPEPEDEVPSAPFAHEHPQYLTDAEHSAISNNPHNVSAQQVGSARALWNANALRGYSIRDLGEAPNQNDTLVFDSATQQWVPTKTTEQTIFIDSEIYDLPNSGGDPLVLSDCLPANVLILGVTADVLSEAKNADGSANIVTSVGIGTEFHAEAWGRLPVGVVGANTKVSDFAVNSPVYSAANPTLHIGIVAQTAGVDFYWPTGAPAKIRIRVHYWRAQELDTAFSWQLSQAHVDEWQQSWEEFADHETGGWRLDGNGDSTYAVLVALGYIDASEFSYDNYRENYHPFFLIAGPQWMVDNKLIELRSLLPGETVQPFPEPA